MDIMFYATLLFARNIFVENYKIIYPYLGIAPHYLTVY